MIKLERPIAITFKKNIDIKWLPEGIELNRSYPVVAIKTVQRKDTKVDKIVEDLLFGVINSEENLVFIASFNCTISLNKEY
jgi:hypothetical protein